MGHVDWEGSLVNSFECQAARRFPGVCYGDADYQHDAARYCILHAPTQNKYDNKFEKAVLSKLEEKDFRFAGVYFPRYFRTFRQVAFGGEADFFGANFGEGADFFGANFDGEANFHEATFGESTHFSKVYFSGETDFCGATFARWADFSEASFIEGALFIGANFDGEANFSKAYFGGASFGESTRFYEATFGGKTDFSEATFTQGADYSKATFKERVTFYGLQTLPQTAFNFTDATIEKPERISFHTTLLRPNWFVDVDAQKFDFSDVEWFRSPSGDKLDLEDEIEALKSSRDIERPESLRKLTKACRRLMNNAEENRDYPTANEFHYWSMEAQRKEGLRRLGLIATLYWAMSGYGERPRRALLVLVGMCASFAALYMVAGPAELRAFPISGCGQLIVDFGQALVYSFAAIARLRPEPIPVEPGLFQFLVTAAGILGPLQIALFALAVRRRVMR
jgi:uncharacterized protein YjbI with pentapeptide repeats